MEFLKFVFLLILSFFKPKTKNMTFLVKMANNKKVKLKISFDETKKWYWCNCAMEDKSTPWNYGGFKTVEEAVNAGTIYALSKSNLVQIERI